MAIESQSPNGQGGVSGILNNLNVDDAQQMMDQTRAAIDNGVQVATEFIKERPIACLAGALALGYVIGKIVSR